MFTQEITIMDRAVYDMGALAGARWLQERTATGRLADILTLLSTSAGERARVADKHAESFGLGATSGGMKWDQYKRRAYAAGWIAGINLALVEAIPAPRLLDVLFTHGMAL
jgi:hypothetical protein